jgi:DNA-binding transcriptional regulator YhcF (GntR family)
MQFNQDKAIFLQIADRLVEQVVQGSLQANQRLPSVRELAVQLEVNPNTIVKSYAYLEENQVIYKQRGKGFYVAELAKKDLIEKKRHEFTEQTLPQLYAEMQRLGFSVDEVIKLLSKMQK